MEIKLSDSFIGASMDICDIGHPVAAPYLRKEFELSFVPESAAITITGIGFYELYVNGEKNVKGEMCPYISNPDDVCYYDTYDISDKLKKGKNCIGLILGNGFRNAFGGFVWDFQKSPSRGPVACALYLEAEGSGERISFEADESFKTHSSPILWDDLRMGYQYDSRLEEDGWCLPEFDDSKWNNAIRIPSPKGEKRICEADPVIVREELAPVSIKHYDELAFAYAGTAADAKPYPEAVRRDVYVYDFGINSAGVTALKINGRPGQKIVIRHAERLNGDKFNISNIIFSGEWLARYLEYAQKDVFICRGGEETFIPRFKYDGFRYAFVEGLLPEQATAEALTYRVIGSKLDERSDFICSDETLNALQRMTRRSDLANFCYFPTDCPHREKNGWTGDASVSSDHMLLNLKASASLREWMRNVSGAQREDGALPGIVPTGGWGFHWGNGPAWDMVAVNLPYHIYKYDGDAAVIKENAKLITNYLSYAETKLDSDGLAAYGLGDWCDPSGNPSPKAPLVVTDSIQLFEMASRAEKMFAFVGLDKEAELVGAFARKLRNSIRKHLIAEDMTVSGNCQCSQAFALDAGIFDDAELGEARKRLIEIIHRDGDITLCGMIGMRHIFHALVAADETELAYELMTDRKHHTCYGYWVESGSTTMLESFSEINSNTISSRNHHFFGDVSAWMIREIAGLDPTYFKRGTENEFYYIRPHFVSKLDFARTYFEGSTGKATVEWRRERADVGAITLEVFIPPYCDGEVQLPNGWSCLSEKGEWVDKVKLMRSDHGARRIFKIFRV